MIIAKNISGGKMVTILNDMQPKNKIRNDTSLSHLFKDSSGSQLLAVAILLSSLHT